MPAIEITQEQADALAERGYVTLRRRLAAPENYIAVRDSGHVFTFEIRDGEQRNVEQVYCPPGRTADVYNFRGPEFQTMSWYTIVKVKP